MTTMFISKLIALFLCCATVFARTANEKLISCCANDPRIDSFCAQKYCNIPNINSLMVLPFIAECSPKGETLQLIWDCVSSRHDHTECCQNQGVLPLCMAYCNAVGSVPTDMVKYGICIGEFEKYRVCFRTYLKHNPNVRGEN